MNRHLGTRCSSEKYKLPNNMALTASWSNPLSKGRFMRNGGEVSGSMKRKITA